MKKLTIILLTCFSFIICKSQESVNNLNANIKDIVFVQILNNLEVNYPIIVATPAFFAMTTVQHTNLEMLFDEDKPDLSKIIGNSGLNRQEFFNTLNLEFFPKLNSDTTVQIQAKMKNKLLYTVKFRQKRNTETYIIAVPDESFSKEITYQNGLFKSLTVVKPDERYWVISENKSDSLVSRTAFNSKSGKYSFVDDFYENNILTKKVLYKSTANRKSREIKQIWNYSYDSNGSIISIACHDSKGTKTDSINYFYSGSKLNSIITHTKDSQSTLFYHPETGLISDYLYNGFENTINSHYEYNQQGLIKNVLFKNTGKPSEENYVFEYNSTSNLVSIRKSVTNSISNDLILKNQYIFSYNQNHILTSIMVTDQKGIIQKEISYEINYLN